MIHMLGSTSSFHKAGSSFPTDQVVTCSHITIIRRGVDELRWSDTGRGFAILVGAPVSLIRVDMWSSKLDLILKTSNLDRI